MFKHEYCRGFDILNHAIRMGNTEDELRLGAQQTLSGSSHVSPEVVSSPMQSSNSFQFPWKLYDMLEQAEQDGLHDIVAWQGDGATYGTSFRVFKPQVFVEKLMPRYFKQTKYKSFQRQLNLYGYTRINEGPGKGGYKHKHFLRGNKDLCQYISRQSSEESGSNTVGATVSSSSNPTFYKSLGALSTHIPMIAPRNATRTQINTVSPETSTNQFAAKPANFQLCDKKEITDQYRALIQKDYQFPWKLYEMLDNAPINDYEHIVSWQPPGNNCFRVHDPIMFVSCVMPLFFKQTKYKSFQRQLNLYGFSRVDEGPNRGSYWHKLFQKDRKDLLNGMNRQKIFQCESRLQIRSRGTGKDSAGKENSAQSLDVSEPISSNSVLESSGSEVKCIDHGIPTILQSMAEGQGTQNEFWSPTSTPDKNPDVEVDNEMSSSRFKWRRTISDGSSDWIIVVLHNDTFERESFHVHRRALSCGERKSNYFARLFQGASPSSTENVLVLGTAEAAIFSKVLDYIYFNITPKLDMRTAFSFFTMGKSLGIDSLRQLVVDFYRDSMDRENIEDFIQVVSDFEDNSLLEAAIDYFATEMKSMDVSLAGKLKPQILRRILCVKKDQPERLRCDATTTSRYVAESLHNHAKSLSRDQLQQMVDDEILTSIDAVTAIKLLAVETSVGYGEQTRFVDSSLRHRCVTTITKEWSRLRNEFEKSPTLVNAFKSVSSEVLFEILMKTTQ
ncbi:unnamed protein product [Cylindrotheca closterium]|uniref:BTB domain-containing protein n=1 Tax=Cylindrotheca closterium TaxID=2856 RepID=A0AAD2JH45_9STRA|nr:unnamed protein product [Cylindrotheca closterium]